MLVLVANLGSTSFKFKLLDMSRRGLELSSGGYERIGLAGSAHKTHDDVIEDMLAKLDRQPDAIGFKAVHGGPITSAVRVTEHVMQIMAEYNNIAPAHNPPYLAAMKALRRRLPKAPQVAAFETAFHHTIPLSRQLYAVPKDWIERYGVRRYGFHGASHQYIAQRAMELAPEARRVISCHLGGSCSVCAIDHGRSVANSFGMAVQSGLPHNCRVGDIDAFAIQTLLNHGLSIEEIYHRLGHDSGLLGLSGISSDMRDIERAATAGNSQARLTLDTFVESARHYLGAYLVALGGCDLLAFTGGIGENSIAIRESICRNLLFAGIELDHHKNQTRGREMKISSVESDAEIWIIPANEELIVARQTVAVLTEMEN